MTLKTTYFRDDKNPDRVLCVVHRFDEATKTVSFGWSINKPSEWKAMDLAVDNGKEVVRQVLSRTRGDQFSRKEGRYVALDRFGYEPLQCTAPSAQEALRSVLYFITTEGSAKFPKSVVRVAEQHKDRRGKKAARPSPEMGTFADRLWTMFGFDKV